MALLFANDINNFNITLFVENTHGVSILVFQTHTLQ